MNLAIQTKTAFASALFALLFCAEPAVAYTLCGQGKLTKLELIWGGDSDVRFSTESMPADAAQYREVQALGLVVEMAYNESPTRWNDRLRLLELAFALQVPVQVVVSGDDCIASADEFDITLCTDKSSCSRLR